MNSATIQGKITDIYKGKQVSIVTVVVKGMDRRNNVKFNYPQILFRGNSRIFVDECKKGDYVTVMAEVKSRQITNKANSNKRYFDQYLNGIAITPASNEMSEVFNTELRGPFTYKNEIYIEGSFISAIERNNTLGVLIRPDEDDFNLYCVSYIEKDRYKELKKGTRICVRCEMQTSIKEREGQKNFLKNLVITNFGIPGKETMSNPTTEDFRKIIRRSFL